MWPDRASNPGPLTYESGALPTALSGPATDSKLCNNKKNWFMVNTKFMHWLYHVVTVSRKILILKLS